MQETSGHLLANASEPIWIEWESDPACLLDSGLWQQASFGSFLPYGTQGFKRKKEMKCLTFSLLKLPSGDLWECQSCRAVTCSEDPNDSVADWWLGSVELLNLLKLNIWWMNKTTHGPRVCHVTKTRPAFVWCWNLFVFVQFLLHFYIFSDLWKWLALHQWAVPHVQLFVTVRSKQWAWLWIISHRMDSLLTVTVAQFE